MSTASHESSKEKALVIQAYSYAERFIFWLFFNCLRGDSPDSHIYFVVRWVVLTLQLGRFLSDFYPHGYNFGSSAVGIFVRISRSVSFFGYTTGSIYSYAVSLAFIVAFAAMIVFASITHKNLRWEVPLVLLRYIFAVVPSLLFVPITEGLSSMFFPCVHHTISEHFISPYTGLQCWAPAQFTLGFIGVFVLIVYFIFCQALDAYYYHTHIPSKFNTTYSLALRTSNGHDQLHHLCSLLLTVATLLLTPSWRPLLGVLLMLWGAWALYHQVVFLPFLHDVAQALHFTQACFLICTGAFALAAGVPEAVVESHGTQSALQTVYLASLPLCFMLGALLVNWRYWYAVSLSTRGLCTPQLVLQQARAHLRAFRRAVENNGDSYVLPTPELEERSAAAYAELESILNAGILRFPECVDLRLFMAHFFADVINNRNLAYAQLLGVAQLEPCDATVFRAAFLRHTLDQAMSRTQSLEVLSYLEFKRRKAIADTAAVAAGRSLAQLWTHLLLPAPDLDTLSTIGVACRVEMARARVNYAALLKINPHSVPVLRVYALLLLDIFGDLARACRLFARAGNVEHAQKQALLATVQSADFLQRIDTDLDIFDERNAVFVMSVERDKLGQIMTANAAARKLFGYEVASDLVGRNIRLIMPEPIGCIHDALLRAYLVRGNTKSRILNYTRMVFGLHKQGYLIPLHLFVRVADEATGKLLGVIQAIPPSRDVHLMVHSSRRTVTYATSNCLPWLGLHYKALAQRELPFAQLLPCLDDNADGNEALWAHLWSRGGLSCEVRHQATGQLVPCECWGARVHVGEETVIFVRVAVGALEEEVDDYMVDSDDSDEGGMQRSLVDRYGAQMEGVTFEQLLGTDVHEGSVRSDGAADPPWRHAVRHLRPSSVHDALPQPSPKYLDTVDEGSSAAYAARASFGVQQLMMHERTSAAIVAAGRRLHAEALTSPAGGENLRAVKPAQFANNPSFPPSLANPEFRAHSSGVTHRSNPASYGRRGSAAMYATSLAGTVVSEDACSVVTGIGSPRILAVGGRSRATRRVLLATRAADKAASQQLQRLQLLSRLVSAVFALGLLLVLLFGITAVELLSDNFTVLEAGGVRTLYALDAAYHMRSHMLLKESAHAHAAVARNHVFPVQSPAQLRPLHKHRVENSLSLFEQFTAVVDEAPLVHGEQRALRDAYDLPMASLAAWGSAGVGVFATSAVEGATLWSACARAAVGEVPDLALRLSTFVTLANGQGNLSRMTTLNGEHVREGLADIAHMNVFRIALVAALTLAIACMVVLALVLPHASRVEAQRTRVLAALLAIPRDVRHVLRRRALGVVAAVQEGAGEAEQSVVDATEDAQAAEVEEASELEGVRRALDSAPGPNRSPPLYPRESVNVTAGGFMASPLPTTPSEYGGSMTSVGFSVAPPCASPASVQMSVLNFPSSYALTGAQRSGDATDRYTTYSSGFHGPSARERARVMESRATACQPSSPSIVGISAYNTPYLAPASPGLRNNSPAPLLGLGAAAFTERGRTTSVSTNTATPTLGPARSSRKSGVGLSLNPVAPAFNNGPVHTLSSYGVVSNNPAPTSGTGLTPRPVFGGRSHSIVSAVSAGSAASAGGAAASGSTGAPEVTLVDLGELRRHAHDKVKDSTDEVQAYLREKHQRNLHLAEHAFERARHRRLLWVGLRYLLVFLFCAGALVVCIRYAALLEQDVNHGAARLVTSSLRGEHALLGAYFAREHLLRDYDAAALDTADPTITSGAFHSQVLLHTHQLRGIERSFAYGRGAGGVAVPQTHSSQQQRLLFADVCPHHASLRAWHIPHSTALWDRCSQQGTVTPIDPVTVLAPVPAAELMAFVDAGVSVRKGVDSALAQAVDVLDAAAGETGGVLSSVLSSGVVMPTHVLLFARWKEAEASVLDLILPSIALSTHLIRVEEAARLTERADVFLATVLSAWAILLLLHLLVLEPVARAMMQRVRATHALLTLLSSDVLLAAPAVGDWARTQMKD